jgi:hypothetical protein
VVLQFCLKTQPDLTIFPAGIYPWISDPTEFNLRRRTPIRDSNLERLVTFSLYLSTWSETSGYYHGLEWHVSLYSSGKRGKQGLWHYNSPGAVRGIAGDVPWIKHE